MLGKAKSIKTYHVPCDSDLGNKINQWLEGNAEAIVLDIKFSSSATNEQWGTDALIIYKEV